MNKRSPVLFIGVSGSLNLTHYASLQEHGFVPAVVSSYRDLCQTKTDEQYSIAVLLPNLSETELVEGAHFVRRRWPTARILIIRAEEWWIDDALYDDRVIPGANPNLLLSAVERLTE